jgi:hypothetical protein
VTRDYFPGQPFRDYDPARGTCTPSIEGAASRAAAPHLTALALGVAAVAALLGAHSAAAAAAI